MNQQCEESSVRLHFTIWPKFDSRLLLYEANDTTTTTTTRADDPLPWKTTTRVWPAQPVSEGIGGEGGGGGKGTQYHRTRSQEGRRRKGGGTGPLIYLFAPLLF